MKKKLNLKKLKKILETNKIKTKEKKAREPQGDMKKIKANEKPKEKEPKINIEKIRTSVLAEEQVIGTSVEPTFSLEPAKTIEEILAEPTKISESEETSARHEREREEGKYAEVPSYDFRGSKEIQLSERKAEFSQVLMPEIIRPENEFRKFIPERQEAQIRDFIVRDASIDASAGVYQRMYKKEPKEAKKELKRKERSIEGYKIRGY
ncbi:MAG: hypothetical protein QXP53_00345 [Candidatus Pacearchaeota archaeon]